MHLVVIFLTKFQEIDHFLLTQADAKTTRNLKVHMCACKPFTEYVYIHVQITGRRNVMVYVKPGE